MTVELNETRPLTVHETGFIDLHSHTTPQVISGVCFLDAKVEPNLLIERVRQFIDANPLYSFHLTRERKPRWVRSNDFRVEDHVECISSISENDSFVSHVAEKATSALQLEQPPWGLWLTDVDSVDGKQVSALAFSAHHSLVDGLKAFEFLDCLTDRQAIQLMRTPVERFRPARQSGARYLARAASRRSVEILRCAD